ncbi:hypothetical protein GCM10027055_25670 [Janibacter alkaliphilus]|uniref:DUF3159 domain-containing protein n=1 Tax=Janibacter alkaliphilus TaxID=1069963 RepID=A0A852X8V0_9MICO|nr:hypothetical protein [Janibacter alkaliphilus]
MAEPTVGGPGPAGPVGPLPVTTVEELIRRRLSDALGGVRGSLETTLPMLAFVIVWASTADARLSLGAAAGLTVLLLLARLAQRQTPQFVLTSVVATGLAAFFALRSGNAEDAFLPGILTSIAWGIGALLSVLLRWPVVGFMIGAADPAIAEGDPFRWRRNPAAVRVCSRLTLVLVGLYAIRVAIMGPLYLAGNIAALTVAKVVLGWPLWAGAVVVMGLLLVRGRTPIDPDDELVRGHSLAADAQREHGPA